VPLYVASQSDTDRLLNIRQLAESLEAGRLTLRDVFADCQARNKGTRILLIADQFEEAFTSVEDEGLRNRFIDLLLAGFADPASGCRPDISLILTLRADFYGQALRHRPLADALQGRVENLGPMNREELQAAIRLPAERAEVSFDPGLVETLLDNVENKPGSLPVLQFALREMWGRQEEGKITRKSYDEIGGVEGALAQRAETIFGAMTGNGANPQMAQSFRRLFTRLVTLGEGQEDTRRVVDRRELGDDVWSLAQRLAGEDNRLVVTNAPAFARETAEVVHEALIRHWPRLVDWIDRDRGFQSWLRGIRPNLELWQAHMDDEGPLLRGGMLAQAAEWVARRGDDLAPDERRYVEACLALHEREERAKAQAVETELRRQQELANAQRGRARVARIFSLVAGSVAICAVILAILFMFERGQATRAEADANKALVRSLVNSGQGLLSTNTEFDDIGAMIAALRAEHTLRGLAAVRPELRADVRGVLQNVVYRIQERNRLPVGDLIVKASFDRDGTRFAAVDVSGKIYIWGRDGATVSVFQGPSGRIVVHKAAFTADLDTLVTVQAFLSPEGFTTGESSVLIWDLRAHGKTAELKPLGGIIHAAAVDPDGRFIATAGEGGLHIWDMQGVELKKWGEFPERAVSVAFSPDGNQLAWGSDAGVRILSLGGSPGVRTLIGRTASGPVDVNTLANALAGIAFVPGKRQLVVAGRLWDLDTFSQTGDTTGSLETVFSSDGKWIAKNDRGTPEIITLKGDRIARLAGHTEGGFVQAIGPGRLVLTSGGDNTLRLWDESPRFAAEFKSWRDTFEVDISEDPRVYATRDVSYEYRNGEDSPPDIGRDNAITLWSPEGQMLGEFPTRPGNLRQQFALSPDAATLAVCYDTTCRLWNTRTKQSDYIQLHGKMVGFTLVSGKPALVSVDGVTVRVHDGLGADRNLFSLPSGTTSVELNTARTRIIAASPSGVSVWNLSGQRVAGFEIKLASSAKVLAGSDIRIGITDVRGEGGFKDVSVYELNGKLIASFQRVGAAALSPDGTLLATSRGYHSVATLWDVETRRPVAQFSGNGDFQLRFTPDGKFVTVVGNDAPPRVWPVNTTEELVTAACKWIGDYLLHNSNITAEDRKLCELPTADLVRSSAPALPPVN
jgi:WD40 repeat protein